MRTKQRPPASCVLLDLRLANGDHHRVAAQKIHHFKRSRPATLVHGFVMRRRYDSVRAWVNRRSSFRHHRVYATIVADQRVSEQLFSDHDSPPADSMTISEASLP